MELNKFKNYMNLKKKTFFPKYIFLIFSKCLNFIQLFFKSNNILNS